MQRDNTHQDFPCLLIDVRNTQQVSENFSGVSAWEQEQMQKRTSINIVGSDRIELYLNVKH